ncbi:bifunctional 4-hydroxy-2-oxoglutarate aldolase/2-dehydro-3-deoxy-phosphogluconate aldolase [Luteithermobacter gelatinilyticus]|uniref:bifunctional 4-hydroxy-2-oxoglutarate aldolase/2-dehydro-3-deoxy-phosphogluconate aldolase n=1 Tax=Luteithermobacter gelatinilyticus TaxID=2582913 RepID=UPI0011073A09|nr:bifunctional 4-hydroxy-2-oxoglutarate aldolase/2-dehydro-3-deoxy-phosphogluconate aldolase [Luteithermobacter gelatinilyticus]
MMMRTLAEKLETFGVIPVVTIEETALGVPLAQALTDGGLPVVEVTFRTAMAADAIREIKMAFPDMLIGAGTILQPGQVDQAIAVGADFLVAPGCNPAVIRHALAQKASLIPGCVTPSDIETARREGLRLVKFFPAEACRARDVIPALNGPYPDMRYMPTGGIRLKSLEDYLTIPNVMVCGGSWIAPGALMANGDWETISMNARQAVEQVNLIREETIK